MSCNDITTASGLARTAEMEGPFAQFLILRVGPKRNKWSSLVMSVRIHDLSRRCEELLSGVVAAAVGGRPEDDNPFQSPA